MQTLKQLVPDVLLVIGAVSISYGSWLIYPPAGFIVAGAIMFYTGTRLA